MKKIVLFSLLFLLVGCSKTQPQNNIPDISQDNQPIIQEQLEQIDTEVVPTQKVNRPRTEEPKTIISTQPPEAIVEIDENEDNVNTIKEVLEEPIPVDLYAKYRNPQTGEIMTPEELVSYYDVKCTSQNMLRSSIINSDGTISCITYTEACQTKFGINSFYSDGTNECNCAVGYAYDSNDKCVVIDYNALCQTKYGVNSYSAGENFSGNNTCGCKTGYYFNQSGTSCQLIQATDYNNAPYRQDGNAYSPEQLNAMDCAWYGINCPTINVRIID